MASISNVDNLNLIGSPRTNDATLKEPPLRRSFAWTLAGNVIYAACQWGMLSVLAKMGSPSVVGQFALALAITAPVFMLTNLGLRGVQATDAKSEYEFGHYFTLRLAASLLGIAVVAGIALAGEYERTTAAVLVLVAVAKAVESMSDVAAGLLQKHERLDQVAVGLMLKGATSVTAFTMIYRITHLLTSAVVALVCSWGAVALFYDLRLAVQLEGSVRRFFRADWQRIHELAVLSAPMGLVMAMIALNINIPRFVIEQKLGHRELGIFAAMASLVTAAGIIVNALGQSASARLSRMFARSDVKGFKSIIARLVLLGILIFAAGVSAAALMGRFILSTLYTPMYATQVHVLEILAATAGISAIGSFVGYGITAARKFNIQLPIVVLASLTSAIMSLQLVPRYGLLGASVALCVASVVQSGTLAVVLTRVVRDSRPLARMEEQEQC